MKKRMEKQLLRRNDDWIEQRELQKVESKGIWLHLQIRVQVRRLRRVWILGIVSERSEKKTKSRNRSRREEVWEKLEEGERDLSGGEQGLYRRRKTMVKMVSRLLCPERSARTFFTIFFRQNYKITILAENCRIRLSSQNYKIWFK